MRRTKIKICGITNEKDAFELAQMAVDALGFIITEKNLPFKISLKRATKIISQLPPFITSVVGVHRKYNSLEEVIDILGETNPDAVQLQFGGSLREIEKIKKELPKLKIIKSVFLPSQEALAEVRQFSDIVDMILIHETKGAEILQKEFFKSAKAIVKASTKPVMLAGGLGSKNVGQAIKIVRPYAVDLITGAETIPGRKDFKKVKKIIEAIRWADKRVYG